MNIVEFWQAIFTGDMMINQWILGDCIFRAILTLHQVMVSIFFPKWGPGFVRGTVATRSRKWFRCHVHLIPFVLARLDVASVLLHICAGNAEAVGDCKKGINMQIQEKLKC